MLKTQIGVLLALIGIIMMVYTGFNYTTTEKVIEIGSLQINKEKNHYLEWQPIIGLILLVGGIIMIVLKKRHI